MATRNDETMSPEPTEDKYLAEVSLLIRQSMIHAMLYNGPKVVRTQDKEVI